MCAFHVFMFLIIFCILKFKNRFYLIFASTRGRQSINIAIYDCFIIFCHQRALVGRTCFTVQLHYKGCGHLIIRSIYGSCPNYCHKVLSTQLLWMSLYAGAKTRRPTFVSAVRAWQCTFTQIELHEEMVCQDCTGSHQMACISRPLNTFGMNQKTNCTPGLIIWHHCLTLLQLYDYKFK